MFTFIDMIIEVTKPYNKFRQSEDENTRIINVLSDTHNFNILVGLTTRHILTPSRMGDSGGNFLILGGIEALHRASIAISVNFLGEMRLVKNRWSPESSNDELEVREILYDLMVSVGFNHFESSHILTVFNRCVADITDENIICSLEYPHGVSRRRYLKSKLWVKKYTIKKHSLV